ncbi:MAG: mechanosensitive ion channel domain-containing protein [Candidatus Hermodarchaeota archaeon]
MTLLHHIKKISAKRENEITFILNLISFMLVIFLILEGFPSIGEIDPTYTAILTGAISTGLAFASKGIFSNIVSGIVLTVISPVDVGDIVKIKGKKGIIRQITLSKIVLETFEGVLIEISNAEVISSTIINYTKKIGRFKNFEKFKKAIQSPQVKGFSQIENIDSLFMKKLFEKTSKSRNSIIHKYTFSMEFPYNGFRLKIDRVEQLCLKYRDTFGAKPWFDIVGFGVKIKVKFSILTLDSTTIVNDQPKFAKDLYKIIFQKE